jgi:hypothetical protein
MDLRSFEFLHILVVSRSLSRYDWYLLWIVCFVKNFLFLCDWQIRGSQVASLEWTHWCCRIWYRCLLYTHHTQHCNKQIAGLAHWLNHSLIHFLSFDCDSTNFVMALYECVTLLDLRLLVFLFPLDNELFDLRFFNLSRNMFFRWYSSSDLAMYCIYMYFFASRIDILQSLLYRREESAATKSLQERDSDAMEIDTDFDSSTSYIRLASITAQ